MFIYDLGGISSFGISSNEKSSLRCSCCRSGISPADVLDIETMLTPAALLWFHGGRSIEK
jgi:hypothetical protein